MAGDLKRIGQFLRETRERRGLTVDDVSKALFLRKTLVRAIETGDRATLPHDVYVRGYIREYAQYLKVQNEIQPLLIEREETEVENLPKPVVKKKTESAHRVVPRLKRRFLVYPALGIVLGVALVMFIFSNPLPTSPDEQRQTQSKTSTVAAPERKVVSEVSDVKRLMITCHERAWVSILIDGIEKKEFMLSPHEIVVLNAKDRFDILVGNAGGVKIFFNGKDSGFEGASGQVRRISLS